MLNELYDRLYGLNESLFPITEKEEDEDEKDPDEDDTEDMDTPDEDAEAGEETEDERIPIEGPDNGDESDFGEGEPDTGDEADTSGEETAFTDTSSPSGGGGLPPETSGDTEETEDEYATEEEKENNEIEKQYLGKKDESTYYWLNKTEKGWNVTDAEGKIVYPTAEYETTAPTDNVLDFIIQAQKDLEMPEISGDIFKRYVEPAVHKEDVQRAEDAGFEFEDETDTEEPEEEESAEPEAPFSEELGTETEAPITIESVQVDEDVINENSEETEQVIDQAIKDYELKGYKLLGKRNEFKYYGLMSVAVLVANDGYTQIALRASNGKLSVIKNRDTISKIKNKYWIGRSLRPDESKQVNESMKCPDCGADVFEEEDLEGYGCAECGWTGDDAIHEPDVRRGKRGMRECKCPDDTKLAQDITAIWNAHENDAINGMKALLNLFHNVYHLTTAEIDQIIPKLKMMGNIRDIHTRTQECKCPDDSCMDSKEEEQEEADSEGFTFDERKKRRSLGEANLPRAEKYFRVWGAGKEPRTIKAKYMLGAVAKYAGVAVSWDRGMGSKNNLAVFIDEEGHFYKVYRELNPDLLGTVEESAMNEGLLNKVAGALIPAAMAFSGSVQAAQPKTEAPTKAVAEETNKVSINKIWELESSKGKDPNMTKPNKSGALGHFQFLESTWKDVVARMKKDWDWKTDALDYDKSSQAASYYLNRYIPAMLKEKKVPDTIETRLAAYNWGAGNVSKAYRKEGNNWLSLAPKETKNYIKRYGELKERLITDSKGPAEWDAEEEYRAQHRNHRFCIGDRVKYMTAFGVHVTGEVVGFKGGTTWSDYLKVKRSGTDKIDTTDPNSTWKIKESAINELTKKGVELRLVRKPETDEWVVKYYENGKYNEEKTYYTDDKDDAIGTMKNMQARIDRGDKGYTIEESNMENDKTNPDFQSMLSDIQNGVYSSPSSEAGLAESSPAFSKQTTSCHKDNPFVAGQGASFPDQFIKDKDKQLESVSKLLSEEDLKWLKESVL